MPPHHPDRARLSPGSGAGAAVQEWAVRRGADRAGQNLVRRKEKNNKIILSISTETLFFDLSFLSN